MIFKSDLDWKILGEYSFSKLLIFSWVLKTNCADAIILYNDPVDIATLTNDCSLGLNVICRMSSIVCLLNWHLTIL